jgi:hypothetical protein
MAQNMQLLKEILAILENQGVAEKGRIENEEAKELKRIRLRDFVKHEDMDFPHNKARIYQIENARIARQLGGRRKKRVVKRKVKCMCKKCMY